MKTIEQMLEEADEAWMASNESPPFSLFVAKWFYDAGVRDAAEKCNDAAKRHNEVDQLDFQVMARLCERAILALLDGKGVQPPTVEPKINNTMLYINGSETAHRCSCGCNVYNKLSATTYECNSCGDVVTGD